MGRDSLTTSFAGSRLLVQLNTNRKRQKSRHLYKSQSVTAFDLQ
jgi:hypothetical protein